MADDAAPSPPNPETPPPRTTGGNWRWEPPSPEELQALMPGYTIEKVLGRGGMGAVYRGVQTNLDRPVAIKILPPGVEKEDPSFAERFKSEARLMAKLNHPAVVAVYDFGTTLGGQLYFAMEYVDGSDVSQMIAAQGRLPPDHALAITAHVCDALAAAHELGIVHRDIKPANVLLNMKGQVKVADFGLAKVEDPGSHGLTKTGYAMGTPDFVAPEALTLGTAIDGRADLYAVGVMLYQMLTGNIPRGAWQPASVLVPGVDRRFDAIITKAMQYDREHRHRDATELRRELDVIMTVPLVQQDAPAMAAIPVAQVAEAPGQRSAIQKPVGRPPQGGAGTSARRSTPGGAAATVPEAKVHAPAADAKSKAPLFIGIVAAAAIAIGAFVMFGGKKDAKPAQPNVQATATTTSSKPTPLKPAKPPQTTPAQQPPSKPQPSTPTSTAPQTAASLPIANLPDPDGKPADLSKPVKVFILLGSDEMMGYGKIPGIDKAGTLENAVRKQRLYPFLADDSGKWTERMDVRSVSVMRMSKGDGMDVLINDWLRITGTDIGPEISLGHKLGNALDEPVLLLKSCNGNRSLGWDLLPPGSKAFEFSENGTDWIYAGYKESPNRWAKGTAPKKPDWHAGKQYDYDIGYAKAVLADLGKYYPGAKKHEIAGFFFWQGGRDLGDAGHVSRYEQNLMQMIEQVRRDLKAPNAPFVCATLGEARKGDSGKGGQVLAAQLAVDGGSGKYPQFKGNVATVYSHPLSHGGTASSHYDGNAQTFMDVGLGMGDAMVRLLSSASPAASGAALPIPASADKFPPGQWVKVFTKSEDLPAKFQKAGSGVRLNDGKLEVDSTSTYLGLALAAENMNNCAVRATLLSDSFNLRMRGDNSGKFSYVFKPTSIEIGRPAADGRPTDLPRLVSFTAPPKTEQQWEFGAVGNSLITRRSDKIVGFATDARIKSGMVILANLKGTIRDIEVINLDGLPEAEALKILGVDAKGNDLRKSAVVTPTSPAPSVSASSDKFPPGQWVNIGEQFVKENRFAKQTADGWIELTEGNGTVKRLAANWTNGGVRLRRRWEKRATDNQAQISLTGPNQNFHLKLNNYASYNVGIQMATAGTLANGELPKSEFEGECTLELVRIGSRLIARINDRIEQFTLKADLLGTPVSPHFFFGGSRCSIRDIEVINLDGLSEAEALKIVGLDEKGNDLRAAALAAEKQAMAQAKAEVGLAAIPELKALHEQFKQLTAERVTAPFDAEVAKLNAGYVGGIDREIASEKQAGHLDGVIALEAEKKLIQGVTTSSRQPSDGRQDAVASCPIPAEDDEKTSEALKKLRAIYRDAYAKLEATRAANRKTLTDPLGVRLRQLVADLTQQDRVPNAKAVREYREALEAGSAVTPDRNAIPGGDAATTKEADKSARVPLGAADLKGGFTNSLGMKFLPVKGTEVLFCIHETRRQDYAAYANEVPGVNGLWKNQTREGVPCGDKDDHPVVGVSWDHASAFCEWLSKKEGKTYRLPTDREWSYAVGIGRDERWTKTTTPESLKGLVKEFPWGGDFPPETKDQAGNYGDSAWHEKFPTQPWLERYSDGFPTTAPVMSFKPNNLGLYDMGGNAREWVEDWWNEAQVDRVMRGAFFGHITHDSLLSSFRDRAPPNRLDAHGGFRVVVEVQ